MFIYLFIHLLEFITLKLKHFLAQKMRVVAKFANSRTFQGLSRPNPQIQGPAPPQHNPVTTAHRQQLKRGKLV